MMSLLSVHLNLRIIPNKTVLAGFAKIFWVIGLCGIVKIEF